jgi:hypothetical protein
MSLLDGLEVTHVAPDIAAAINNLVPRTINGLVVNTQDRIFLAGIVPNFFDDWNDWSSQNDVDTTPLDWLEDHYNYGQPYFWSPDEIRQTLDRDLLDYVDGEEDSDWIPQPTSEWLNIVDKDDEENDDDPYDKFLDLADEF